MCAICNKLSDLQVHSGVRCCSNCGNWFLKNHNKIKLQVENVPEKQKQLRAQILRLRRCHELEIIYNPRKTYTKPSLIDTALEPVLLTKKRQAEDLLPPKKRVKTNNSDKTSGVFGGGAESAVKAFSTDSALIHEMTTRLVIGDNEDNGDGEGDEQGQDQSLGAQFDEDSDDSGSGDDYDGDESDGSNSDGSDGIRIDDASAEGVGGSGEAVIVQHNRRTLNSGIHRWLLVLIRSMMVEQSVELFES